MVPDAIHFSRNSFSLVRGPCWATGVTFSILRGEKEEEGGVAFSVCVQWNLSNLDTIGTEESVLISGVILYLRTVFWERKHVIMYKFQRSTAYTEEPSNKEHFEANSFVPCREVVPISEVK